jgi:hypothetical protein
MQVIDWSECQMAPSASCGELVAVSRTVEHGVGGWELTDADWNEKSGFMQLDYVRTDPTTGVAETCTRFRTHPTQPSHVGWDVRDTSRDVSVGVRVPLHDEFAAHRHRD